MVGGSECSIRGMGVGGGGGGVGVGVQGVV